MTKVLDRMARDVVFVRRDEPLSRAVDILHEKKIRHLPVLAELDQLVGIITDRDVKLALPSSLLEQGVEWRTIFDEVPVSRIMTTELITVEPEARMDDAVRLLIKHRIGALPVVEEGSLIGLLTETDALRYCIEVIATHGG